MEWSRLAGNALLLAVMAGAAACSCSPRPESAALASGADSLTVTPVGRFEFESPEVTDPRLLPEELSGIAWTGGDDYLAIGDAHACVHRLAVRVDPKSGRIQSAKFEEAILLRDDRGEVIPDAKTGEDREGIAYDADSAEVWIANERTGADAKRSSLARHRLSDGRITRLVGTGEGTELPDLAGQRPNRGFESLTRTPDGTGLWTATEGPLRRDGPEPTDSTGAVVRLQRLDVAMAPVAQYAYAIDPFTARITSPFFLAGTELSGVSELIALPDGRLLALERAFAGDSTGAAGLRCRLYVVDTAGATDVSRGELATGLSGRTYAPARKTLLWELDAGLTNSNFEGMTLGPALSGRDRLLLLIADNNEGGSEALYSLRIHIP